MVGTHMPICLINTTHLEKVLKKHENFQLFPAKDTLIERRRRGNDANKQSGGKPICFGARTLNIRLAS